jgi:hypothetical protein
LARVVGGLAAFTLLICQVPSDSSQLPTRQPRRRRRSLAVGQKTGGHRNQTFASLGCCTATGLYKVRVERIEARLGTTWGPHALPSGSQSAGRRTSCFAGQAPLTCVHLYPHFLGVKCAGQRGPAQGLLEGPAATELQDVPAPAREPGRARCVPDRAVTHGVSRSLTGDTQVHVSWAVARPVVATTTFARRAHPVRSVQRPNCTRLTD